MIEIDPNWPIGIEKRWISENPWLALERIYLSGILNSDPAKSRHVCATLGLRDSMANIDAMPWNEICGKFGYSAIVAHDVVDHLPEQEAISYFLSSCFESLSDDGKMYIMCHPYKSRLGNHLFLQNKAYLHIIKQIKGIHTLAIDDPVARYRNLIKKSGFKIEIERVYFEFIEDYFQSYSLDKDCEIQFVEYILVK